MVMTTYPDGSQKKKKEEVPFTLSAKNEAKKLSSAATHDHGTKVLRTDAETDAEADLTDSGVSGIIRLNISEDNVGPELKEEIIGDSGALQEVNDDTFVYWLKIYGRVVGDATLIIPLHDPLNPIMSIGEIMILPNPVINIETGWEKVGQATFYNEPKLTNCPEPIIFEPLTEDTISKVMPNPTHTMTARSSAVKMKNKQSSTSTEKKIIRARHTEGQAAAPSQVAAPTEAANRKKMPSKRKQITGPNPAILTKALFDTPDVRKVITRKTRIECAKKEKATVKPKPKTKKEDGENTVSSDEKEEEINIELQPWDKELNLDLLDYEPLNVSRGSSILDDTDTDLKVNVISTGPKMAKHISLNTMKSK